jgi:hypothetical protein
MDIIKGAKITRDEIQRIHRRDEKRVQNFGREGQQLQYKRKNDMKMELKYHLRVVQHNGQTGELCEHSNLASGLHLKNYYILNMFALCCGFITHSVILTQC